MVRTMFAVLCLLLAGCDSQTPPAPSDLAPPSVSVSAEMVTRADVEKADNAVRAAAVLLKNSCPPDGSPRLGDKERCTAFERDLNGYKEECNKKIGQYNGLVQAGLITNERVVPKVTANGRFGGTITCDVQ